ncbi:MAG: amino acid ABC transporter permease [Desulfovibrio sp.]
MSFIPFTNTRKKRGSVKALSFRTHLLDVAVLITVSAALGYIFHKVSTSLNYLWDFGAILDYVYYYTEDGSFRSGVILQGFVTTIRLSIWAGILGTILGITMGLFRTSKSLYKRLLGKTYVGFVRNTPPLVLIFIFYFFIGDQILPLLGLDDALYTLEGFWKTVLEVVAGPIEQVPAFTSAVLTLAIFEGAYITEIVRAGITAVDSGQWEAAKSQGLSRRQQLQKVIIPQAFRFMIPPLTGQYISVIKDSSIVSVISIQELTFQGMEVMAGTYKTFEIWIIITALYFCMTFACSRLAKKVETKMQLPGYNNGL